MRKFVPIYSGLLAICSLLWALGNANKLHGDSNRVYEIVFDGFEADKPEKTYYVGNYYEHKIVGIKSPPDQLNAVTAEYMLYFPIVHQERETVVTSYYYADGERIAMKSEGIIV